MSAAAVNEACYCGTRWRQTRSGYRVCGHCDRPPAIATPFLLPDGTVGYRFECPSDCSPCRTIRRRSWSR